MRLKSRLLVAAAAAALICAAATSARAATIDIVATADGWVTDLGNDGTFDQLGPLAEAVQTVHFENLESSAIFEFDLSGVDPTESIVSAMFLGTATSALAIGLDPDLTLDFFGYAGNGAVDVGDATAPGSNVGTVTVASAPDPFALSIPVDPLFVEGLLGSFLGLSSRVGLNESLFIASLEHPDLMAPTLRLVTLENGDGNGNGNGGGDGNGQISEPGLLLLISAGMGLLGARGRRGWTR